MFKKFILLSFILFAAITTHAQTADEVYNKYLDFNLHRLQGENDVALTLGQDLIPNVDKLKQNARVSFYYSIGNLFENDGQSVKAIEYYEKVDAAVPNYYVVQRALGYLYLKDVEAITTKLNAAKSDINENKRLIALYSAAAKKALPHLEKAQACDPDDDTLSRIKSLYKNMNDAQGAATLTARLKALSKNCIDLLDDK
ncbi:tetratricopeptide (TPR) repeat protein [Mucilaginibacter sp. UYP25]|uniref:tetratricopeptide repeat protein n=1 Tax=unclassified Mucilaginibacter TaxID=2617802 RepID=UPI003397F2E4